ncbi:flagellar export protein FliJ [candidate division WOR-1 bacterium RIFCSPHIGHO2_01_FULL_53_15]|uniref:Flagellar FliJ protein n=1 Tax=candidate division WOR-1 bacterium RIFCSPHIGHO2_01_FULL_53_15 TaxID=1802564 RepID=A0A1F4Q4R7_UNCSA|nr:MAG: flagellar export protein FliJ [candidate division WOR-1 bacterium RIFCSPHIGHO2_01_FULL_53_15]OGC10364.1 MAG: flagellar export protein FliJ [candidate division WOR-1 bacterium RIFCSPHIGHO2_02_FULL_53_26]
MAKEVKPGKKFKYDLQAVLKVRAIKEKKEQEKFAEKNRAFLREKQREEAIKQQKKTKEEELRDVFRKGPISNFEKVMRRRAHLDVLKDDLNEQVEKVIEASKVLEEQRARLVEAVKDKKIMEKHKERKLDEYNKLMQRLELKFMDEIATQRFKHEKEP